MGLHRLGSLVVIAWFLGLSACASQRAPVAPTSALPLNTSVAVVSSPAPIASAAPTPTAAAYGEVYLLLRTASPPYYYQLARVPATCLLMHTGCGSWSLLPKLPGSSYSPGFFAPLAWSPDGSIALFQNINSMQSFSFDPASQKFTWLADLPLVTDQVVWSADNQWGAMPVQGGDASSSHIVLVNPHSGQVKTVGANWDQLDPVLGVLNLTRMQYPLGWLGPDEMLIFSARSQPDNGSAISLSPKRDPAAGGFYRLNVQSGALTALAESPDWTTPPSMASTGNMIALPIQNRLSIRNVAQLNTSRFEVDGTVAQWSPDGKWLATVNPTQQGVELDIVSADGGSTRKIQLGNPLYALSWFADSEHALVATRVNDPMSVADRGRLLIISIGDGSATPVVIPGLDLNTLFVAAVSLRP